MKKLLKAINRGILRGLNESTIEILSDLDDDNLGQIDSLQTKSINNKIDWSIKHSLAIAIQTGYISSRLKRLINDHNNFHTYKGIIKAHDKNHLRQLIKVGQELFGNTGNFNWIDTSEITDMSNLFHENNKFNGHIELWDVSNVTNMADMFSYAKKFNQPIGDWDVSNVTDMSGMFGGADSFNKNISNWDVSNVITMRAMFCGAIVFNQPLNHWDVSAVRNMSGMFAQTQKFNQDISNWNVSAVRSMSQMFYNAGAFNQNISNWNVTINTKDLKQVFLNCPIKEEYKFI